MCMNLKKVILVVGGVALLGTPLFLTATGVIEFPLRSNAEFPIAVQEMLDRKGIKLPTEGCDQSATTTPCAVLQAMQARAAARPPSLSQPPQSQPVDTSLPENGPLVHTYTDSARGFSFKYPDGFKVVDGDYPEQKRLVQPGAAKGFGMILDFYGSPSLSAFAKAKRPQSLGDFQSPETKVPAEGYGNNGSYMKEVTKNNTISVLPNGVKVLFQTYEVHLYDAADSDVSERDCIDCRRLQRYVLFKNPQNYVTIVPFMTDAMEKRIIQSIEYR